MYVGVDWAGKSWFAVRIDDTDDAPEGAVFPTIWNLWREWGDEIDLMLVDIPIGLAANNRRACDVAAKEYLKGTQGSSVFYTPTRDAVESVNIEIAKEEQEGAGFGIQNQAWSLVPRIREVDAFVSECEGSASVVETHPEVCFAALNGEPLGSSKKRGGGAADRVDVLDESVDFDVQEFYADAKDTYREPPYAPMIGAEDDILDALVAAITAALPEDDQESLIGEENEGDTKDDELDRTIEMRIPTESGST